MSKLGIKYLLITFSVMLISWGICMIFSLNGITFKTNPILLIPYALGGISPAIGSFFALKMQGKIKNFKEWLKNVFDFKHNILSYLLVIFFAFIFFRNVCFRDLKMVFHYILLSYLFR